MDELHALQIRYDVLFDEASKLIKYKNACEEILRRNERSPNLSLPWVIAKLRVVSNGFQSDRGTEHG